MANGITLLILAVIIAAALRIWIRTIRRGRTCGGCEGCAGCEGCKESRGWRG